AFVIVRSVCYRLAVTVTFPSEGPFGLWVDLVDPEKWVVYAVACYASRNHSLAFCEGKIWAHQFVRRLARICGLFENRRGFHKSDWRMKQGSIEAIWERLSEGKLTSQSKRFIY